MILDAYGQPVLPREVPRMKRKTPKGDPGTMAWIEQVADALARHNARKPPARKPKRLKSRRVS